MRRQGRLIEWNEAKGFGFIAPTGGGPRIFVHASALPRGSRRPGPGEPVSFRLGHDRQRRPRAEKVRLSGEGKRLRSPAAWVALGALLAVLTLGAAPLPLALGYLLLGLASYALYGLDKAAARRGGWRTRESTLHLLDLAGGWPGALLAQRVFRHKTRKQPFQTLFWCSVAANGAALAWLLFAPSAQPLRGLIRQDWVAILANLAG